MSVQKIIMSILLSCGLIVPSRMMFAMENDAAKNEQSNFVQEQEGEKTQTHQVFVDPLFPHIFVDPASARNQQQQEGISKELFNSLPYPLYHVREQSQEHVSPSTSHTSEPKETQWKKGKTPSKKELQAMRNQVAANEIFGSSSPEELDQQEQDEEYESEDGDGATDQDEDDNDDQEDDDQLDDEQKEDSDQEESQDEDKFEKDEEESEQGGDGTSNDDQLTDNESSDDKQQEKLGSEELQEKDRNEQSSDEDDTPQLPSDTEQDKTGDERNPQGSGKNDDAHNTKTTLDPKADLLEGLKDQTDDLTPRISQNTGGDVEPQENKPSIFSDDKEEDEGGQSSDEGNKERNDQNSDGNTQELDNQDEDDAPKLPSDGEKDETDDELNPQGLREEESEQDGDGTSNDDQLTDNESSDDKQEEKAGSKQLQDEEDEQLSDESKKELDDKPGLPSGADQDKTEKVNKPQSSAGSPAVTDDEHESEDDQEQDSQSEQSQNEDDPSKDKKELKDKDKEADELQDKNDEQIKSGKEKDDKKSGDELDDELLRVQKFTARDKQISANNKSFNMLSKVLELPTTASYQDMLNAIKAKYKALSNHTKMQELETLIADEVELTASTRCLDSLNDAQRKHLEAIEMLAVDAYLLFENLQKGGAINDGFFATIMRAIKGHKILATIGGLSALGALWTIYGMCTISDEEIMDQPGEVHVSEQDHVA